MKTFRADRRSWWFAVFIAGAIAATGARAEEFAVVAARVSPDYVRAKTTGGAFESETYTFAEGGYRSGASKDESIEQMRFVDVARTIATPLRQQNYLPSTDPSKTKLLLVVYWGTTQAPEHASSSMAYRAAAATGQQLNTRLQAVNASRPGGARSAAMDPSGAAQALDGELQSMLTLLAMENAARDRANRENSSILGYDSWWAKTNTAPPIGAQASLRRDLMAELESNRYFVVLMAYDFQLLWKQKQPKLLWETRFSVSEHGNSFREQLAAMALTASRYFGQDSEGTQRRPLPGGKIEFGELRTLGSPEAN